MEELIRDGIHRALEVEPTPPSLRSRVMDSLPVTGQRAVSRRLRLTGQWSASAVAVLLAFAIIAGLLYSRGLVPFIPARHNPVPPVGLISPGGVAAGTDGSVYVADLLGDRVFKLRPDGKVVVYAGGGTKSDGPATQSALFHPTALALDGFGNLYITDTPSGTVRKVDTRGLISTLDLGTATCLNCGPDGLAVDATGHLWVSTMLGSVFRVGTNGPFNNGSSLPRPNWLPGRLAFDSAGDLFITDGAPSGYADGSLYSIPPGGGCRIVRLSSGGTLSVVAGTGSCGYSGDGGAAISAQLNDPNGIAFDAAGNLYFADEGNHRVRRIDRNGIITTVAGTGQQGYADGPAEQAELNLPSGMAMSPSGLLYFADPPCQCWSPSAPGRLRVLNLSTGIVATVMTGQTPISG